MEFSNGDPPLAMEPLNDGFWDGTWQTNARQLSEVTIRVEANRGELRGIREVSGGLRSIQAAPLLTEQGIVSAASFQAF